MGKTDRRFVWNLDWNLLRTFLVIAQEQGITAAGDKLLRKQPTISNALRRLETVMGCQLVSRGSGIFELTAAGKRLYIECQTMFASVSSLQDVAQSQTEAVEGNITMALASHVVCPFLDNVLEKFHIRHPGVTFTSMVQTSREVIESVQRRDATLGICLLHERQPQLEYIPLYREFFGYFCGKSHPFFGDPAVKLEDMRIAPYVSFKTDQMSDALWPVALLRHHAMLQGPVVGVSSHLEEVRRLIISGYGFGPLPVHVVSQDVQSGLLWPLPPHEEKPSVDVQLVIDPKARPSLAESHLVRMLREEIINTPIEYRTYRG